MFRNGKQKGFLLLGDCVCDEMKEVYSHFILFF